MIFLRQPSCSKTTRSADVVNVKMQRYKQNLKYNLEWTVKWWWMQYNEQEGGMVCTYCKRFGNPSVVARGALVSHPIN